MLEYDSCSCRSDSMTDLFRQCPYLPSKVQAEESPALGAKDETSTASLMAATSHRPAHRYTAPGAQADRSLRSPPQPPSPIMVPSPPPRFFCSSTTTTLTLNLRIITTTTFSPLANLLLAASLYLYRLPFFQKTSYISSLREARPTWLLRRTLTCRSKSDCWP
jgi:hypothetical protein